MTTKSKRTYTRRPPHSAVLAAFMFVTFPDKGRSKEGTPEDHEGISLMDLTKIFGYYDRSAVRKACMDELESRNKRAFNEIDAQVAISADAENPVCSRSILRKNFRKFFPDDTENKYLQTICSSILYKREEEENRKLNEQINVHKEKLRNRRMALERDHNVLSSEVIGKKVSINTVSESYSSYLDSKSQTIASA